MSDASDRLLYVLSARREMAWAAFKQIFDQLYVGKTGTIEDSRFQRGETLRALSNLAHCEFEFGRNASRVYVLPPALLRLPQAGLPQVILAGARSPETITEVKRVCAEHSCLTEITEQIGGACFTPLRVMIQSETIPALENVARALGIAFESTPPAWSLANASGSLKELRDSLEWRLEDELNWPRREFDPKNLQFYNFVGTAADLRLIRYTDPKRSINRHLLRDNGRAAEIDCDWGRYAVLSHLGINVLVYDEKQFILGIPASMPLPVLLARALGLCSGRIARRLASASVAWATLETRAINLFTSIPPPIADLVASRIGQTLVPRPI
jgi:hypothetical protein